MDDAQVAADGGVVHRQDLVAREREDLAHAALGECLHHEVGSARGHGGLANAAARGDGPDHLHRAAPDAVELVHHVAHHAAVVRYHVHNVAYLWSLGAGGEIHDAVLLGEIGHHRLRIFHHVPEALLPVLIGGEHLGAAVEDGAPVGGTAHHGGAHAHGAVVPGRRARRDHHDVVEDAGAGAVLGEHGNVLGGEEGRRPPARDHGHGNAGALEQREGGREELPRRRLAVGKGHEPAELHPGHGGGLPREVES